jgi:MFS family permease
VNRVLGFYLASRVAAGAGVTMLRAALMWQLYAFSRDTFDLGVLGAVQFVPGLLLSLPAGVVADRFERRFVVQLAQLVVVAAAIGIAALTFAGGVHIAAIYVVGFLVSAAAAFGNPARAALLASLVEKEHLPRAVTQASTVQALAMASGPLLAGAVIAWLSVAYAYAGAALLIGCSIATLAFISPMPPTKRGEISWAAVVEGLRFVAHNKVVLGAMTLDLVAVILGGAGAMLVVYANDILNVGASGYGLLQSSLEIGA